MSSMSGRVLVVDADRKTAGELIQHLAEAGFTVAYAQKGSEALARVLRDPPDAVLSEFVLPDMSGSELCRRVRAQPRLANVAIVFVSSRIDEIDRVVAFEMGADDYVTKPISGREVMLRLRTLLRRKEEQSSAPAESLAVGGLVLRLQDRTATLEGRRLRLTGLEFALLAELTRCRGFVLSRDTLFERIWGGAQSARSRTVDTHMKRLRAKLGQAADLVETVRGVGYRLRSGADGTLRHVHVTDRPEADTLS